MYRNHLQFFFRLESETKDIGVFVENSKRCGSRIGSLDSFGVPMTVECLDTELKSQHVYISSSTPGKTFTLVELEVYAVGMFE